MNDILINNSEELQRKITKIKTDGTGHLHIVSDFDRTLTRAFVNGKKPSTSFAQLREGGFLSKEYEDRAQALFEKYYPLENSDAIPSDKKGPILKEWWRGHLDLLVEYKLPRKVIDDIISKRNIQFRKGVSNFLESLNQYGIPLLILSAGVGDIIEGVLKEANVSHNNIHIISNMLKFNSQNIVVGYSDDIIHTFNKNEGHVKNSPYYEQIKEKKNVILIGDMLADGTMVNGLSHDTVLKIGFLNEKVGDLREQYMKEFDVVILNDGSFEYINELLKQIL